VEGFGAVYQQKGNSCPPAEQRYLAELLRLRRECGKAGTLGEQRCHHLLLVWCLMMQSYSLWRGAVVMIGSLLWITIDGWESLQVAISITAAN